MPDYMLNLRVVNWAAQECDKQHSGEMSVARMTEAWQMAIDRCHRAIWEQDIIDLAKIIEPEKNANGYRNTPVLLQGIPALSSSLIHQAVENLVEYHQPYIGIYRDTSDGNIDADQWKTDVVRWYKMFEEIHPFIDGNGRIGNILYNWLSGTLDKPVMPPEIRFR